MSRALKLTALSTALCTLGFSVLALRPAAASPEPQAPAPPASPWVTTHASLDFGPTGAALRRHSRTQAREMVYPAAGEQVLVPMKGSGTGEDYPCTNNVMGEEQVFFADVTGDGQNEVFIAWTFSTGVGHDGTLDQLRVCGWTWKDSELTYLDALSVELTRLGLQDADAVSAHLQRAAAQGPDWRPLNLKAQPQTQAQVRRYTMGGSTLQLRQTGTYFVRIEVLEQSPNRPMDLIGMNPSDLDNAGERLWDFSESWELREIEGEPDCCGFELSATSEGAPHITQAWGQGGSIYALLEQEQSKVAPACTVLQIAGGVVAPLSTDCAAFRAERATDSVKE